MASRFATRAACVQPRLASPPACGWRESGACLKVWVTGGIVLLTLAAYMPVWRAGFVNLDDPDYVTLNSHVRAGLSSANLAWSFSTFHAANWHPLTWISLQADAQLYGLEPAGFHVTNVILHAGSAVLLFWSLSRMTGLAWPSALVAALFAAHPLHVESVAWIAERKDVLSGLFWMLTLQAYARYTERPSTGRYAWVALALAAGLLAKPMLVTLPFVLLLLDYWPLGRLWPGRGGVPGVRHRQVEPSSSRSARPGTSFAWLLAEKTPLLALCAASCVMTSLAQGSARAMRSLGEFPLSVRLENAVVAYAVYLGKAVWPVGLSAFYPHPGTPPAWKLAGALAVLLGASALAVWGRRTHPYLLVGWLWYLGTLVPVIGLVQVGAQGLADRYTYLPLLGVFVAGVWTVKELADRLKCRPLAAVLGVAAVMGCMVLTWVQIANWRDSFSLWSHALAVDPRNAVAHINLGACLGMRGELAAATRHYRRAIELSPGYGRAHGDLAVVLARQKDFPGAIKHFQAALALGADDPARVHNGLGTALEAVGKMAEAAREYQRALETDPGYIRAHYNLARLLFDRGAVLEAQQHLDEALRLDPRYQPARQLQELFRDSRRRQPMAPARPAVPEGGA